MPDPTTLLTGEEGPGPTTLATGEEGIEYQYAVAGPGAPAVNAAPAESGNVDNPFGEF